MSTVSKITLRPTVTVATLSKRSERIFSLFSQTKVECEALNKEIDQMAVSKKAEAQRILGEVKELENISVKNSNLAKKIDAFINS